MNMTNLTPLFEAFIALAAAIITGFLIPWLKRKTTAQEREELLTWVNIAVTAAQQLYHTADGAKRKKYVLDFLYNKGYDVNDKEIENAIEAAVLKLHRELEAAA